MSAHGSRHVFIVAQPNGQAQMIPHPEFKVAPAPTLCGGTHAWFLDIAGTMVSLGCICHHDPNAELLRMVRAGSAIDMTLNS